MELEFSGVASHHSMGLVEQAHASLRRIFRLVKQNHPTISNALCLRFSVKSLNDTAGDKGLVPSMIVFGVIPSLGNTHDNLPDQQERFNAMIVAR